MHGPLTEVADAAYQAVLVALGEEPDEVVCDLSGVTGALPRECVALAASIGAEVQEWRGSPVGVVCPTGRCCNGWPSTLRPSTWCWRPDAAPCSPGWPTARRAR